MRDRIQKILESGFVYIDDLAEVLAIALEARKNVILWGPGGHGKSAMVSAVVEGLGLSAETFVQSFGEGLDEAALWGGLDFGKLERDHVLQYHPERSFLAHRYAVFEELFDAPSAVLLSLKDTLTAGRLRKGAQSFPMATEVVIGLTNRDPAEIAEMGPAVAALVERFPLHLRVEWPQYKAEDYSALYEKVPQPGPLQLNGFTAVLAEVLGRAAAEGNIVSPRTAVHARDAVVGLAKARGAERVEESDLSALRFVPGLERLGDTIAAEVAAAMARAKASAALESVKHRLEEEIALIEGGGLTPIKALQVAKRVSHLEDELAGIAVPDELTRMRDGLRRSVSETLASARRKAEELTRI